MYVVYVLKSLKDGKHYTGYTSNLERRIKQHNAGTITSTKRRRPFEVVYTEDYATEEKAKKREKYLKNGIGRNELQTLLSGAVPKW